MKVKPRETVCFNGTIYRAGDDLPFEYVYTEKEESKESKQKPIKRAVKDG